jgi:NADPH:quinone reductase-like Zn-dependent oxidoreductase
MKAVVCTDYGSPEVLKITQIEKPVPKDEEVLVKVHSTTVHFGDTRIRRATPFLVRILYGLFKPRKNLVPGIELSGTIQSTGKNVTLFKPGDVVFGLTGTKLGGYAEYCCLSEKVKDGKQESQGVLIKKPQNLSMEDAAAAPSGALTALKNLQKGKIAKNKKVLINGASGSLGTYAIQIAKYFGAEVTAVCTARNFELVKSLGADAVVDYTKVNFTKLDSRYDIVFDAVMKSSRRKCKNILAKKGVYVNNYWLSAIKEKDILFIKELFENKHIFPVIDRVYSLNDIVEAHTYVDTERKKGNVIVLID